MSDQNAPGGSSKTLNVQLIGQKTNMWCWAASGEMTMKFLGHDVTQCAQANYRFGYTNCCNSPTPSQCVQGGWPQFSHWGFSSQYTSWGTALSFTQLQQQIDAGAPVPFSWGWTGGGGHMMVAIGYNSSTNMVYINNPWPVNQGVTKWISYSDYVSGSDHTHWRDYYNISYTGTTPGTGAAEKGNSTMPGAGFDHGKTAATEALKALPDLVTESTYVNMGFPGPLESIDALSLGEPFHVHHVRHDELKAHDHENMPHQLLNNLDELLYPVLMDGQVVCAIGVVQKDGQWRVKSIGDSSLAKDFTAARAEQAEREGTSITNHHIVQIPSLHKVFVAHEDESGDLHLTHIHDDKENGFTKNATQLAKHVFKVLQPLALQNKHALK